MIALQQITLHRGSDLLLENASLVINPGEKIGLIGANGAGKTSLFLLILGQLQLDAGNIQIPKGYTLGHLEQETPDLTASALDHALAGHQRYAQLNQDLEKALIDDDGLQIATIHQQLGEIDAYSMPAQAAKVLVGLGFTQAELNNPVKSFSGGWRMRINLARLLMSNDDILLLDEPTNHLDFEAIVWLENWIRQSNQTIFIISHDREFLDHCVTCIAHLENQQINKYSGSYSDFEHARAEKIALQQAAFKKQQEMKAHMESFVERFRAKATKARQAQSRLKMLEKIEWLAPVRVNNPFHFVFKPAPDAGDPMLTVKDLKLGYGDHCVLQKISLSIRKQDRIALIGVNGAGKSTFIKFLAREENFISGQIARNPKLKIGYFAQHQLELLDPEDNPLNHLLHLDPRMGTTEARKFLGSFNFSSDDVFKKVKLFSGGEKARLSLALIISQSPNLILLDEPTNHLDMEMREALTDALQEYTGAVIIVSHDRYLLKCVTDQIWLAEQGSVQVFEGDIDDYSTSVASNQSQVKAEAKSTTKQTPIANTANNSKELKKLEAQLAKAEEELKIIDEKLIVLHQNPGLDQKQLQLANQKRAALSDQINDLEEKIMRL